MFPAPLTHQIYWAWQLNLESQDSYGEEIHTDNRLKLNTFTSCEFCPEKEKENKSEPIYLSDGCDKENTLFRPFVYFRIQSIWRFTWEFLPAMVLRNMRYSKLEISLLCQRWVMLEDLNSCRGVAKEMRLNKHLNRVKLYRSYFKFYNHL